jgi:hypothetical protein
MAKNLSALFAEVCELREKEIRVMTVGMERQAALEILLENVLEK